MDNIVLLGKKIPIYGLLGVLGVALGILYLYIACKRRGKKLEDSVYILIWSAIAAMVGAKILYLLLECKNIISLIEARPEKLGVILLSFLSGGFVFYGGLFGAITGVVLGAKYFSLDPFEQLNLCIPVMPLVHGFGRIGCHLVGCCYGREYSGPLSRVYENSLFAPNGIGLFPVQLIESIFDFILFAFFVVIGIGKRFENKRIYIYLLSYSIARFILEFFRGDADRGIFYGLSTSQWISILIIVLVLLQIIIGTRKKNRN